MSVFPGKSPGWFLKSLEGDRGDKEKRSGTGVCTHDFPGRIVCVDPFGGCENAYGVGLDEVVTRRP